MFHLNQIKQPTHYLQKRRHQPMQQRRQEWVHKVTHCCTNAHQAIEILQSKTKTKKRIERERNEWNTPKITSTRKRHSSTHSEAYSRWWRRSARGRSCLIRLGPVGVTVGLWLVGWLRTCVGRFNGPMVFRLSGVIDQWNCCNSDNSSADWTPARTWDSPRGFCNGFLLQLKKTERNQEGNVLMHRP